MYESMHNEWIKKILSMQILIAFVYILSVPTGERKEKKKYYSFLISFFKHATRLKENIFIASMAVILFSPILCSPSRGLGYNISQ